MVMTTAPTRPEVPPVAVMVRGLNGAFDGTVDVTGTAEPARVGRRGAQHFGSAAVHRQGERHRLSGREAGGRHRQCHEHTQATRTVGQVIIAPSSRAHVVDVAAVAFCSTQGRCARGTGQHTHNGWCRCR